ncbi:MAG TPA: ABC transporter permease [Planctomycetota bacterium]
MGFTPYFLWSDLLIYGLVLLMGLWLFFALRREYWRVALRQVSANRVAMISFGILCVYGSIALLDTLHFKRINKDNPQGGNITSVLDIVLEPLRAGTEKTYSAPFATRAFAMETVQRDGRQVREFPRLERAGVKLANPDGDASADIWQRAATGLGWGIAIGLLLFAVCWMFNKLRAAQTASLAGGQFAGNGPLLLAGVPSAATTAAEVTDAKSQQPLAMSALQGAGLGSPAAVSTAAGTVETLPPVARRHVRGYWVAGFLAVVALIICEAVALTREGGYHILGTDKAGLDVFYTAVKSIRTGLVIGTLSTLIVTPLGIMFGIMAGYFGGWVDDLIQYVYTTLASIPSILLIAAAMLIVQARLTQEETIVTADKRLVWLCIIMGITSWTGLCRLIRGETLKLREVEYIQAADAFGVSRWRIMARHLVPSVMHLVLISVILQFSGLVLTEAVLAYVGIGVDPSMQSWGNMINQARLELARDPVVWWNLLAAFIFMLTLVLPANMFGDAVRDALDPRLRKR